MGVAESTGLDWDRTHTNGHGTNQTTHGSHPHTHAHRRTPQTPSTAMPPDLHSLNETTPNPAMNFTQSPTVLHYQKLCLSFPASEASVFEAQHIIIYLHHLCNDHGHDLTPGFLSSHVRFLSHVRHGNGAFRVAAVDMILLLLGIGSDRARELLLHVCNFAESEIEIFLRCSPASTFSMIDVSPPCFPPPTTPT